MLAGTGEGTTHTAFAVRRLDHAALVDEQQSVLESAFMELGDLDQRISVEQMIISGELCWYVIQYPGYDVYEDAKKVL